MGFMEEPIKVLPQTAACACYVYAAAFMAWPSPSEGKECKKLIPQIY